MAYKRLKRCKTYGCPNLHYNDNGYCDSCYAAFKAKHPQYYDKDGNKLSEKAWQKKYDEKRGTASQRGYTYKWRQFARKFLESHPACAMCGAPATVCDHKTDTADMMMDAYGEFDYDDRNYQALCARCNALKGATSDKDKRQEYYEAKRALGLSDKGNSNGLL